MSVLLQDYAREQADHASDDVALVLGEQRMTYGQLETFSNQMAHQLVQVGCRRGDRICLLMDKSPEATVGMLASLKAGCAYVPLDVASPARRLERIVRSADPTAVLVADRGGERWEELNVLGAPAPGVVIGALDASAVDRIAGRAAFTMDDVNDQSAEPPERVGRPDDVAHILFTSGSTGDPKGVMITHANVRTFVEWAVPQFGIRSGDRLSGHAPLHFDLSTFDVYGSLRAGAQLHLVPGGLVLARQLADFINDHTLVQWFSVPSAMTYMARFGGLPASGFPSLERVLWCGEVLPVPVLRQWMKRVPQARYVNLYGPTEATIASTFHPVAELPRDPAVAIPIGRPCGGEDVFVLGDQGRELAPGEIGEIHIAGAGVSPGYWRDEVKSQASFVPDPRPGAASGRAYLTGDLGRVDADGVLHFAGRRDTQIKSRGYRIELAEIETAISALSEVAECAVVAVAAEDFSGAAICCAFAPLEDGEPAVAALRSELGKVLPAYMLPSRWQRLDALPKNRNGKIDRVAATRLFEAAESSPAASR
jgi:amino acid adenylation domain-containing protein